MSEKLGWSFRLRSGSAVVCALMLVASTLVIAAAPANAATGDLTIRSGSTWWLRHVAPISNGDLYVTDSAGRLLRVDQETFGETEIDLGARVTAIAVDASDNLYAHTSNPSHVYRVDAVSAEVTVVAGNGDVTATTPSGPALSVGLGALKDMVIDGNGDLVMSNPWAGWLSRLDLDDGVIEPVAGIGTPGAPVAGELALSTNISPLSLAVDSNGHIYFIQLWNRIYRVDAQTGDLSLVAGNGNAGFVGDHGPAVDAAFYEPGGLAIDAQDNVYVADTQNKRVRRIDATSGIVTTIAGAGAVVDGPEDISPHELAFDPNGDLLIVDSVRIQSLENPSAIPPYPPLPTAGAGEITTEYAPGFGQFRPDVDGRRVNPGIGSPSALAMNDRGEILIADSRGEMVFGFDTSVGVFGHLEPDLENWSSYFDGFAPNALAFDTKGNLFISSARREFADNTGYRIDRLDRSSRQGSSTLGFGDSPVTMSRALAADAQGNIYIADAGAHRIYVLDVENAALLDFAGTGVAGFSGDGGQATEAQLSAPSGLAFLPSGELVVSDTGNNRVRLIDLDNGIITTMAGTGDNTSTGDGAAAAEATLDGPSGVAIDGGGNLFVSELAGNRVRRIDRTTGVITTAVGTGLAESTGDGGPATEAGLDHPNALLIDGAGDLWIIETEPGHVRRVIGAGVPVLPPTFEPLRQCSGRDVTIELADGDYPTNGDDVILGTAGPDAIDGLAGNDTICGLQGDDVIDGNAGFDRVFGGAGNDTIDGGPGNDRLVGGPGNDVIRSGPGNDRAFGGPGADVINGGNGTDRLAGGTGNDVLRGDRFADELLGNQGRDQLFGGDGNDILRGGLWIDRLDGGNQDDACATIAGEIRTNCERGLVGLN